MRALAKPFVLFVERFYPDPFVFAIVLTFFSGLMALGLTEAGPVEVLIAWGEGLKGLLTFIAQIALTLVTAHALAHTDAVRAGLSRLGGLPGSAASAYGLVALVAGVASLVAWSLGLVAGAIIARQVALRGAERGLRLHYPLLVASAYAGFVVWHMGYSSSAALFVATPGHALGAQVGGIIPVSETIFAGWNIATALVTLALVPIVCALMRPADDECVPLAPGAHELESAESHVGADSAVATPAERIDSARVLSAAPGLALGCYLVYWFSRRGLDLNLNIVNWSFLSLGLLLARSPVHYVRLVAGASGTVAQIILQYPFYAGIMGLMITTGLVEVIAGWFTAIASAQTLGFWAFLSAGLINFFIPSGGGSVGGSGAHLHRSSSRAGHGPVPHRHGRGLRRSVDEYDPAVLDHPSSRHRRPAYAQSHGLHLRRLHRLVLHVRRRYSLGRSWPVIEQFDSAGYIFLPGLLDSRTVANVQAELCALVDLEAEKLVREGKINDRFEDEPFETRLFRLYESHIDEAPGGYRPELHLAGFFDVFFNPKILDLVETILGPELRLYPNYTVRPKLEDQTQTLVLWHQDGGYTDQWHKTKSGEVSELRMINVWTPLVPARVENGCMQFIPGTHKRGLFTHEQREYFLEIPSEELAPLLDRTIDVELDVGDVVLFHNMLLHRGLPNRTNTVRWNIDWRYQDATQSTLRDTQGHIARSRRDPARAVQSALHWASLSFQ